MSHLQSLLLDDKIPSMWLDPVLYYINKGMIFKNELTKVFELNIFVCYVRAHNIYRDGVTNYFYVKFTVILPLENSSSFICKGESQVISFS